MSRLRAQAPPRITEVQLMVSYAGLTPAQAQDVTTWLVGQRGWCQTVSVDASRAVVRYLFKPGRAANLVQRVTQQLQRAGVTAPEVQTLDVCRVEFPIRKIPGATEFEQLMGEITRLPAVIGGWGDKGRIYVEFRGEPNEGFLYLVRQRISVYAN